MNTQRTKWLLRAVSLGSLSTFWMCVGCNPAPAPSSAALPSAERRVGAVEKAPLVAVAVAPAPAPVSVSAASKTAAGKPSTPPAIGALTVKRFVVGNGVKDREPLLGAPPSGDGSPVYAFVELANQGDSENVRVTFERKGTVERVGDVTLAVPGNVARHRTWAFTRFIRSTGVWEAVLWSESGAELARASFEVTAA